MTRTSVIVPTRGRPGQLRRCLASLERQERAGDFDVTVIDDAPTPDPAVAAIVSGSPLPVRLLHGAGHGAAHARNAGVAASDGDVIVFMDGDLVAPPRWLAEHLAIHAAREDDVIVVGPPVPVRSSGTLAERAAWAWWRDEIAAQERALAIADVDVLASNLSLRRHLLEGLGGFDPRFGALRREDYEFGSRIHASGVEVVVCAEAAVSHDLGTTTAGRLAGAQAEGAGDRLMAMTRPDLIPALSLRAPYRDEVSRLTRLAGAAWRRPRGRRGLLAALDVLERARLVRAWLTLFNAAQEAAWRTGAGPAPYGTAPLVATVALDVDSDDPVQLPPGPAGPVELRWRGQPVGIAEPRGGRYGREFIGDLARAVPPEVLLASDAPAPEVVSTTTDRWAKLAADLVEEPLVLLSCNGDAPPSAWVARAAVALEASEVGVVVHAPGRLSSGTFELHSRRTRRAAHTLLSVAPSHLLVCPATLAAAGVRSDGLISDAGPWVAALDLLDQTQASGLQVGMLASMHEAPGAAPDAQVRFWHARGLVEARDAPAMLPYVRRHALGAARQIVRSRANRSRLASAYVRGLTEGCARRATKR